MGLVQEQDLSLVSIKIRLFLLKYFLLQRLLNFGDFGGWRNEIQLRIFLLHPTVRSSQGNLFQKVVKRI